MFLNFKQMFFRNYPEDYKDEFIKKVEDTNYARGKYFSYVIVFLSIVMYLVAILAENDDIIKKGNFMLLIESFVCLAMFNINLPRNKQTTRFKRLAVYFEVLIVIAWSTSLITLIPTRIEFLVAYAMIVVSVSALMFLKWQATLIIYFLSVAYIIVFSKEYLIDPILPKITTLIFLIIVAWLISRLLYIKEIENFVINQLLVISEQKAQLANSVKTDFLARMSHDMRTPLTTLIGLSEFGMEDNMDEKSFDYFDKIKDSSEYLLSLVNDTLDLQKLEYSNIELDYAVEEISSITKKVLTIIGHEADNRGINMVVDTESSKIHKYIMTDIKRLEQILINILGNALKYTPKDGTVTWVNTVVNIGDEDMIVRNIIMDNGVGMSQEFTKHMYEPFSKEYNILSNGENSTGLGLAICKNLIQTMGGSIECESELGEGTKFTVDIPHKYATKEEINSYLNKKNVIENIKFAEGKKALICEDSNINVQILSKILKQGGIVSEHAKNGLEGTEMAKDNEYDVIFMDIRMPIMDGLTAAEKIRKFDHETPIIALSANAYKEDIAKSIKAGMNAHLAKPFDREKIFEELSKHL